MNDISRLPPTGFLRLRQIIGDPNADPPILPMIPVSRAQWYEGVQTGVFPKPVKLGRISMWRIEDIRALIMRLGLDREEPPWTSKG